MNCIALTLHNLCLTFCVLSHLSVIKDRPLSCVKIFVGGVNRLISNLGADYLFLSHLGVSRQLKEVGVPY